MRIAIRFQSLIERITNHLHLQNLVYGYIDGTKNSASLSIKSYDSSKEFFYIGDEADTIEESREVAAKKSVLELMTYYKFTVDDVSYGKVKMHRTCEKLYRRKLVEMGCAVPFKEELDDKQVMDVGLLGNSKSITIDFIELLQTIILKTGAIVSPIESVWDRELGYISWVVVECRHHGGKIECVFEQPSPQLDEVEQKLARRTINFLLLQYGFEIIDVNYDAALASNKSCSLVRDNFMLLRKCRAKQSQHLHTDVVDTDKINSSKYEIDSIEKLDSTSNTVLFKRRSGGSGDSSSSGVPKTGTRLISGLQELETVVKRRKFS